MSIFLYANSYRSLYASFLTSPLHQWENWLAAANPPRMNVANQTPANIEIKYPTFIVITPSIL